MGAYAPISYKNVFITYPQKGVLYKMAEITLTNENRPVSFGLPDGDTVQLVPWAYVIDRLTANLDKSVSLMENINASLSVIDHKLTTWLDDGSTDAVISETTTAKVPDEIFESVYQHMLTQKILVDSIATKLSKLESIGGGDGSATLEDYESGKKYSRNTLLVDTDTETVYRVITEEYTSITVERDCENGDLKLVGFESQIVTLDHKPTQSEINILPEDTLVAIYSAADTPYQPDALE